MDTSFGNEPLEVSSLAIDECSAQQSHTTSIYLGDPASLSPIKFKVSTHEIQIVFKIINVDIHKCTHSEMNNCMLLCIMYYQNPYPHVVKRYIVSFPDLNLQDLVGKNWRQIWSASGDKTIGELIAGKSPLILLL